MTAVTVDQLVSDYLSRLKAAAADLPDGRRTELLTEIREHIETARSEGVAADEATTRTMLDQLGEPDEIAAAAREELDDAHSDSPPSTATVERRTGTGLELAAVLLLTIGSFIPVIGWAVGVVLLWTSQRWTVREKLLGTLIVPTGPAGVLFFGGIGLFLMPTGRNDCVNWTGTDGDSGSTCSGSGGMPEWIGALAFIALLIAPFVVAGLLYSRARARADAEPPVARPVGALAAQRTWTGTEITAVVLLGAGPVLALMLSGVLGIAMIVAPLALLAGLVFVWASTEWTQREKWIGTTIAAVPMVAIVLLVLTLRGM